MSNLNKENLIKSAALLNKLGRLIKVKLHLLTALSLADAIFLCLFYACIAKGGGSLVIQGDAQNIHYLYYGFAFIALRFVVKLISAFFISNISYEVEVSLRDQIIAHLISLGPLSDKRKASLIASVTDAFDDIIPFFTHYLTSKRYALVVPSVLLAFIFMSHTLSGVVILIICPLIPIFMIMVGKGAERLNQRQWVRILRLSGHFTEALQRLTFIKLFNLQQQEINLIKRLTKNWRVQTMQILKIAFLSSLVLEFFSTAGVAFCAVLLGFAVYEQGFDYTYALFVLLCAPEFFLPLRTLGQNYHIRMKSLGAISNIADLMSSRPSDKSTGHVDELVRFDIKANDLKAVYEGGRVGLLDVNLYIKEGEVTALVGPSGCGKSTLLQLLIGFVPVESGSLSIGAHDVGEYSRKALTDAITFVPQNPHLFYGTLRDNIKIGCADVSDDAIVQALDRLNARFLLERFPDGLDHRISDENQGISGGEARLIALARALIKDSPLVLLDEPTASLDEGTQKLIVDAINRIKAGRTVIISAHHQSLIDFADSVIDISTINKAFKVAQC